MFGYGKNGGRLKRTAELYNFVVKHKQDKQQHMSNRLRANEWR